MKNTLILIPFLLLTTLVGAANLNSLAISQKGQFTQLLPEITGLEEESGLFGFTTAIDGEYLVVSAAYALNRGAVAVYRKSSSQWELLQMLDTVGFDGLADFGSSVAISGNKMVVGSRVNSYTDTETGGVVVYELIDGLWKYAETIVLPHTRGRAGAGPKVTLKGDRLLVAHHLGVNQSDLFYIYTFNNNSWQLDKTIDDMDLDSQPGTSQLDIDFDERHMVLSRSQSGSAGSLLRVYDLTGNTWSNYQILQPTPASHGFGNALSLDGNRLVVADDSYNSDAGVVYFFEKTNGLWQLQQTIEGPEADMDKEFGSSVQLQGEDLVVGSYGDDETAGAAGAAFYFKLINGQWVQQQKLLASDGAKFDNFGSITTLKGDELVISAMRADTNVFNAGKVYSFQLSNGLWSEAQVIAPLPTNDDSLFSNALAMDDQWLAVGADGDNDMGESAGAVYLYRKSQGSLDFVKKIYAEVPEDEQQFGKNLVLDGDVMLVAATGNRVIDGYVHYYKLVSNQWVYQSKFKPADSLPTDYFGYALSLDNGLLAVSAMYQSNETDTGAVYLFKLENNLWVEQQKLLATAESEINTFGFNLSLSGGRLAVSTYLTGKVFVFENNHNNWLQVHVLSQSDIEYPDIFGRSINLVNNQLIASAGFDSPLVYNFTGSGLSEPYPLDNDFDEGFDLILDIGADSEWLVLSSKRGTDKSSARVYQYIDNTWQYQYVLSKPFVGASYHNDIKVYNKEVLIGDFNNSQRGYRNGAAYWVKDLAAANFKINQGLNGNWYNTETSGQGLFLDVVPSRDYSFMGLFTYDTSISNDDSLGQIGAAGHRWLVGEGVIDQAKLTINYQLYYAYDGLFDNPRDATTFNTAPYGSMSIKFEHCAAAEVSYELFAAGLSNSYSIQRQVATSGELCDYFDNDLINEPGNQDSFDYRLNGAWYNPETSGQGLFIDKFKGTDAAFMGWFTYDTSLPMGIDYSQIGAQGQRWLVGAGAVDPNNNNIINYQLYYTAGGLFDDPIDPVLVGANGYGNLRIEFTDCAHAHVTYEIDAAGLSGNYPVIRVVPDPESCAE